MSTPLFLNTSLKFTKVASGAKLEADPEMWPSEILKMAHKELPFLQRCELDVELDRVDPLRGYAVGKILMYPARMTKEAAAGQDKLLSMPVIVRDREMSPLDVYSYKGEMHPMDDEDVNGILFRPDTFEQVAPRGQFTGTNLYSQLTPPNTDHQYNAGSLNKHGHEKTAMWPFKKKRHSGKLTGFGHAPTSEWERSMNNPGSIKRFNDKLEAHAQGMFGKSLSDLGRTEHRDVVYRTYKEFGHPDFSKKASADLLKVASPTFREADVTAFREQVIGHPGLKYNYLHNPMLAEATDTIVSAKEKTAAEMRSERRSATKPTVVQFVESGKGYLLKTANHRSYSPEVREISRFDAQKMLSAQSMQKLQKVGHLTLTSDHVMAAQPLVKVASAAERFGIYRVWDGAQPKEGLVVSRMVGVDGRVLDSQVFLGDDAHAIQEKIAGSFEAPTTLLGTHARGKGVFVYQEGNRAVATEPLEITNEVSTRYEGEKVAYYNAKRMATGESLRVYRVEGLQKIAAFNGELHIPARMVFCNLKGRQTKVASDSHTVNLLEQKKLASHESVDVVSDGSAYEVRGHNANVFAGQIMSASEAAFALGSLGLTDGQSSLILKTAAKAGSARVAKTRQVVSELTRGRDELVKAAHYVKSIPNIQVDLVKEVGVLTDPAAQELWKRASVVLSKDTVNTILALNFVTPENASTYVDYLPAVEKVASVLAELVVASRLGMDDVRESAARNAMEQLKKVAKDLSRLREKIQ